MGTAEVQLRLAVSGIEEIQRNLKMIKQTFESIGGLNGDIQVKVDQRSLKELQQLISIMKNDLSSIANDIPQKITIDLSDDSISKMKRSIEQAFVEALSKSKKKLPSVPAPTRERKPSRGGSFTDFLTSRGGGTSEILGELTLLSAELTNFSKGLQNSFGRIFQDVAPQIQRVRDEIGKETEAVFTGFRQAFSRDVLNSITRTQKEVGRLFVGATTRLEDLQKFATQLELIDFNQVNLAEDRVRQFAMVAKGVLKSIVPEGSGEAKAFEQIFDSLEGDIDTVKATLSGLAPLLKTTIGQFADQNILPAQQIIEQLDISERIVKEQLRLARATEKNDIRRQARLKESNRFFAQISTELENMLQSNDVARVQAYLDQWTKFGLKVTADVKSFANEIDEYQAQLQGVQNQLSDLRDARLKDSQTLKENTQLSQVQRAEMQSTIDARARLISQLEAQETFISSEIARLRENSREFTVMSANIRGVANDLRSLARVQEEDDKLIENTQRNVRRLAFQYDALRAKLTDLKKTGDFQDPARIQEISSALQEYNTLLTRSGTLISQLQITEARSLERLRENFVNGVDIFSNLAPEEASRVFKSLEDATKKRFSEIRREVEETQQALRTFTLTPTRAALTPQTSIFFSVEDLEKKAKEGTKKIAAAFKKIDTQGLITVQNATQAATVAQQDLIATTVKLAAIPVDSQVGLSAATQKLTQDQIRLNQQLDNTNSTLTESQIRAGAVARAIDVLGSSSTQDIKAISGAFQDLGLNLNGQQLQAYSEKMSRLNSQFESGRPIAQDLTDIIRQFAIELGKGGPQSSFVRRFFDEIKDGSPRVQQFTSELAGMNMEFLDSPSAVRNFLASFEKIFDTADLEKMRGAFLRFNDSIDDSTIFAKNLGTKIADVAAQRPNIEKMVSSLKGIAAVDEDTALFSGLGSEFSDAGKKAKAFLAVNELVRESFAYTKEAPSEIRVSADAFRAIRESVERTNESIRSLVTKNNDLNESLAKTRKLTLPRPQEVGGSTTLDVDPRRVQRQIQLPKPTTLDGEQLGSVTLELGKISEATDLAYKGMKRLNDVFNDSGAQQAANDVKVFTDSAGLAKNQLQNVGKLENPLLAIGDGAAVATQRITGLALSLADTQKMSANFTTQILSATQLLSTLDGDSAAVTEKITQLIQVMSGDATQKFATDILKTTKILDAFDSGATTAKVAVSEIIALFGQEATQKLIGVDDLQNIKVVSQALKGLRQDLISVRGTDIDISNIVTKEDISTMQKYIETSRRLDQIDESIDSARRSIAGFTDDFIALNNRFKNLQGLDTTDIQLAAMEFEELKKRAQKAFKDISSEIRDVKEDIRTGLIPADIGGERLAELQKRLDLATGAVREFTKNFAPRNFAQSAKVIAKANETVISINDSYIKAGQVLGTLNDRLRAGGVVTLEAIADYKALIQEITRQKKAADQLIEAYGKLQAQGIKLSQTEQKNFRDAQKASQEFGNLAAQAKIAEGAISELEKETKQSSAGFKIWSQELSNSILQNLKFVNSITIVSSIMFGLRSAFTTLVEESKVFSRTLTVMTSNSLNFAQIQDVVQKRVRETAIAFGESVQTVAEIVKQFGSAGFSTETSLAALDSTLRTIVATQANAEATTRTLAGIYRVFGEEIRGNGSELQAFKEINDVIISVYRKHQVELDELNQGMKFVASAANAAGFSFQDTSAFLAVLNDNFIKSGAAGRGLQVLFSQFAKNADKFSRAFNIELDRDKSLDVQFKDVLKQLNKQFTEGKLSLRDLEKTFQVFGLRGARPFITLVKQFDAVVETSRELNEEAKDAGEALSQIVRSSLSKQFESAKQALLDLLRLGVEPLTKAVVVLGDTVKQIRDFFNKFKFAGFIASAALAIAGLTVFVQTMIALSQVFITLSVSGAKSVSTMFSVGKSFALVARESIGAAFGMKAYASGTNRATLANKSLSNSLNETFTSLTKTQKIAAGVGVALSAFAIGTTIAVALGVFSSGLREINQEIDRLTVKISTANQEIRNLDRFEKELRKIQQLSKNSLADEEVIGSKIVQAYDAAGNGLSVQAGLLTKTTQEIGRSVDSLVNRGLSLSANLKELQKDISANAKLLREEALKRKIRIEFDSAGTFEDLKKIGQALKEGGIGAALGESFAQSNVLQGSLQGFEKIQGLIVKQRTLIEAQRKRVTELSIAYKEAGGSIDSLVGQAVALEAQIFDGGFFGKGVDTNLQALVASRQELNRLLDGQEQLTRASSIYQGKVEVIKKTIEELGVNAGQKFLKDQIDSFERAGRISESAAISFRKLIDAIASRKNFAIKPFSEKDFNALANTGEVFDDFIKQINAPFNPKVFESVRKNLIQIRKDAELGQAAIDNLGKVTIATNFKAGDVPNIGEQLAASISSLDQGTTQEAITKTIERALIAAGDGQKGQVLRRALAKEVENLDTNLSNSRLAQEFVSKFFVDVNQEIDKKGNIKVTITPEFDAQSLAKAGAIISQALGGGNQSTADFFDFLQKAYKKITLEKTIKEFEILKDQIDDAILSQTSLNKVVGRRQEIQRLSQLVSASKVAERSFEAVRARYAQIVKERTQLLLDQNNGLKQLTEQDKKRLEFLTKERELYKKDLENRKQLIIAKKKDRLETQKELNNLKKQNLLTRQLVDDYESGFAKLLEQREVIELQTQQLPKILELSESIVSSRDASREALTESLSQLGEIAKIQNEIANGVAKEASDRFDALERIQKLVNPANKLAGIEEKIAGSSVRVARINDQLNSVRGVGLKQSAERLFLWRKLIEEAEKLTDVEKELKKKASETNKLLSKRAEILKKLRDLFKSDSDKFTERIKDIVSSQFQRDVIATAAKLEKLTGIASNVVIPNQKYAIEQLILGVKRGEISLSAFGGEAEMLGRRLKTLNDESSRYNGLLVELRDKQIAASKRMVLSSIAKEDAKEAQKALNDYLSKINDSAQQSSQKRELALREVLRLQDKIDKLKAKKTEEVQFKLKLLNRDELLEAIKALRDRLAGEITTKIKLQIGTENIAKAKSQFKEIFAGFAGSASANFFNNDELIKGFKKTTDGMTAALNRLNDTFARFKVFSRSENQDLKQTFERLFGKLLGQLGKSDSTLRFQTGGMIPGYGGGDQVPALLEMGEYVIPKEVVSKLGKPFFDKLRRGEVSGFQSGGMPGEVTVGVGAGEARRPEFNFVTKIQPPVWPELPTDSLVIANKAMAENIKKQGVGLKKFTDKLKATTFGKSIVGAVDRTQGKDIAVQAKEIGKVLGVFGSDIVGVISETLTPLATTFKERKIAAKREKKPKTDFAKPGAEILKRSPIASAILGQIRDAIKSGQEEINKFLFGFLVPEFAVANTRAFESLLQKIVEINKQFEASVKSQQRSLSRNESDYFSYLNAIQDAERKRVEDRIAAEEEYRKQLKKTQDVFAEAAKSGTKSILDGVAKASQSLIGGIGTSLFGDPQENINQLVGQFKDAFEKISFSDIFGKGIPKLVNKLGKEIEKSEIGKGFAKALAKTKAFLPDFGGLRGDFLDIFGEVGDLLGNTIFASIQGAFGFITSGLGSLVNLTASEDNGRTTVRFIEKFVDELPMASAEFINNLTENAELIIGAIADGAPVIIDTLVTRLPQFLDKFVTILSDNLPRIVDSIASGLPLLVNNLGPVISKLIQVILKQLPTLIGGLAEALPLLIGQVIQQLPYLIIEATKAVVLGVVELIKGLFKGIGGFFKGLTKFHSGGMIGGRQDEVVIMAQKGEGILSRKGMQALGGPMALDKLNSGKNPYIEGTFHDGGVIGRFDTNGISRTTTNNTSNSYSINVDASYEGGSLEDNKKSNDDLVAKIDRMLSQRSRDRRSHYNNEDKT